MLETVELVVGCGLALPALLLTLLRLGGWQTRVAVVLQAFAPLAVPLYAAVLVLLLLALAAGAPPLLPLLLAPVAAAALLLHLWWLLPLFRGPGQAGGQGTGSGRSEAVGRPELTVMTANILTGRADVVGLPAAAREPRVDLLVVQELTTSALATLERAGVASTYPHRAGASSDGPHGTMVFAREPLTDVSRLPTVNGSWAMSWRGLRVHADHPAFPLHTEQWRSELRRLVSAAAAEPADLLLGDLNATLDHSPVRQLSAHGFRDAAEQAGSGWQPTWPANGLFRLPVPACVAIDHIFTGPRLLAVGTATVTVSGTDHRALLARLVVVA